jgi:His-Xaa-Ser system protein HxsD
VAQDSDFVRIDACGAIIGVQPGVYGIEPILRAVHRFTDRCYVHVERQDQQLVLVRLQARNSTQNLHALAGQLCNDILDQSLRASVATATEPVRRLVIAQAFSQANLMRPDLDATQAAVDPLKIGTPDA